MFLENSDLMKTVFVKSVTFSLINVVTFRIPQRYGRMLHPFPPLKVHGALVQYRVDTASDI